MIIPQCRPRIIFVGDSGIGKTALIHHSLRHRFSASLTQTIGAPITDIETDIEGEHVRFQFWDTAGQGRYRNVIPMYFKGISSVILVFSMTGRQSFLNLDDWVEQVTAYASDSIGVLVCGHKISINPPEVDQVAAEQWANAHRYTILFTSAFTGEKSTE
jgi:small GTP-binding protein